MNRCVAVGVGRPMLMMLAAVVAVALGVGCSAAAPDLDPGGFSVDFSGVGETPISGDDLLRNGGMEDADEVGRPSAWEVASYVWLPVSDPERQSQMHERIKPLMRWESGGEQACEGQRSMHLSIPRSAYDPSDPAGHEFCAYFHQTLILPQLAGDTKYVLSYHYRGESASDIPNSRPYVRVTFYDNEDPSQAQQTRVYAQNIFQSSGQWRRGELQFAAPQATRCLDVRLALTGPGEVWFDQVALHLALTQERGPTVRVMPGSFLDNLYCLSTGDAGVMVFGFRNESSAEIEQPQLLLQLPAGIEILDLPASVKMLGREAVHVLGADLTEYRLDISSLKGRIRDGTFRYPYNMWDGLVLLLRTTQPASDTRYQAHYWLEDGAYSTDPLSFDFRIVPPVPTVAGPESFRSGAHLFLVQGLAAPEGVEGLARLYRQVGFNSVHVSPSALSAELGRLGVERYTQPFANGYTMGDRQPKSKPEDAVFRLVDSQPV